MLRRKVPYKPFPHPLGERVKRLKITLKELQNYIRSKPSRKRLSTILRGVDPMPGWMAEEITEYMDIKEFGFECALGAKVIQRKIRDKETIALTKDCIAKLKRKIERGDLNDILAKDPDD
ncbi:hypothetical protein ACFLZT_00475 [Thermodesulfobacteriota bacterium]